MRILPNKIQRDLLKRHIGPFVFSFFTIMFLLLMQFLMLHIDKLVGKGIPFLVIVELIMTNLAYMVVLAAPMAVLVAAVVAYGGFAENRELSAIEAGGVNPLSLMRPALITAVLLSLFLAWFSNDVLPDANQEARSLFIDIRTKKPGFDLEPHTFYDGIKGYTFLVKRIDTETDSLYDVTLFQEPGSQRDRAVIKAKKGLLKMQRDQNLLTLFLHDGTMLRQVSGRASNEVMEKTNFEKYRISFDLTSLAFSRSSSDNKKRSDRTMSARAMRAVVDSLQNQIRDKKAAFKMDVNYLFPEDMQQAINRSTAANISLEPETSQTYAAIYDSAAFTALAGIRDSTLQQRILSNSQSTLRKVQANYENTTSNLKWRQQRINQYLVEIHKKFSIPFACVVFLLLGAPIGMLSRKGNLGFAALVSAGLLTFYWISIIQGEKLADRLYITPFWGMWFADIILFIIGTYLTVRLVSSFRISNIWKRRA